MSETVSDVLKNVENFEEAVFRFAHSIRHKRQVLTKVMCKNLGIDASSSSAPLPPQFLSETASPRLVSARNSLRELTSTALRILKRGLHAQLDQMLSACFQIDLKRLYRSGVGGVIRSFKPVGAEPLNMLLDSFAQSGETQTLLDDLAIFMKAGADMDGLVSGKSALIRAIYANSLQAVTMLAEEGANLETKSKEDRHEGTTALHCACYELHPELVEFLVGQGANVNALDNQHRSPLAYAVFKGSMEISTFLLERRADLHTQNSVGCTLLHQAAIGNRREIAEMLLDRGLEVDVSDSRMRRPLLFTAVYHPEDSRIHDNVEVAEFLLDRGADPNLVGQGGLTIAMKAAMLGCVNVLKLVISRGVDVHATSEAGRNALHYAASWPKDEHGFRLSHQIFPQNSKREIAEFLVSRGVNTSAPDALGNTASRLARREGIEAGSPLRVFLNQQEGGEGNENGEEDQWHPPLDMEQMVELSEYEGDSE
uniref:Uncharacterized protein n=1 Tax=Chromera velia CCMP2878 TaxID=1169474 RepID=A0A0G4IFV5_9ALVE|eukprot:Cvel_14005.t1-p1 / transcript=Cvel_14005.t1 / gene=Cvel_14005 / organism=Chromera_velia_CCMP2878 / gene_product=Ankyrin repeat domain-containing protein 17, putative / transcript_product=Ankyrin repeat domain-containing protein 17, putative / location=Cvel_scaffold980:15050-16492(-) / protein_length=481 / sequence_SO=supercontig / SO=protein_coding / is_pseudo=false